MAAVHRVSILSLPVDDFRWPFAHERRGEIDAHFAALRAANPALWNGRVLLGREPRFEGKTFSARYFETDFASFIAWRDWGFPDATVFNGFGMGALRGRDGGFILGEMAAQTSNAGKIYFPSGTPDLDDVVNGHVDIAGSVTREMNEETGLAPSDYIAGDVWHCVPGGPLIAFIRVLDMPCPASDIRARIVANLRAQRTPELSDIHVVRTTADLTLAMPSFVAAFISAQLNSAT